MINLLLFLYLTNAQTCRIQTENGTVDLSKISGRTWNVGYISIDWDFSFCSTFSTLGYCLQKTAFVSGVEHDRDLTKCTVLGTWDQSYVSNGIVTTANGFQLTFKNGDTKICRDKNLLRKQKITLVYDFVCISGGRDIGTMELAQPSNCVYRLTVPTKYACPEPDPTMAPT